MNETEMRVFAVETTAAIEVMRQAVEFLMTRAVIDLPPERREPFLALFEADLSEMPPTALPNADATRFYEEVAEAVHGQARMMARRVRLLAEQRADGQL